MMYSYIFNQICIGQFGNIEARKALFLALGILSNNVKCPQCNNQFTIHVEKSKTIGLGYWCKSCSKHYAVRGFTPFSAMRLDICDILQIIALFTVNTSVTEICEKVRRSSTTVDKVLVLVRTSLQKYMDENTTTLGYENAVEIDETLIAKKRKYNRGREVNPQWLFGAIEREGGKLFLKTVDHRDSNTLGRLIIDHIHENATVYSDEWAAYLKFFSEAASYNHHTVNHSTHFINPENSDVHTQTIEGLWMHLKR